MFRSSGTRRFSVGETVHLTSRVSEVGTQIPTDPDDVVLTSLRTGGVEILDTALPFEHVAEGQYTLVLTTADLEPGTYDLVITHSSGPGRVAVAIDSFVLQPVLGG